MVKHWCKIKNSDNILINQLYNESVKLCNKGFKNWVYNVKKVLCDLCIFVCSFEGYQTLPFIFKQRVIHVYIQEWHGCLERKTNFNYESYLNILPYSLRCYFSRLRVSVLLLRIQTSRYARNNVSREQRYCLCYNSIANIEDEFHVVFICPCYTTLRNKYIPHYVINRRSMFNFLEKTRNW